MGSSSFLSSSVSSVSRAYLFGMLSGLGTTECDDINGEIGLFIGRSCNLRYISAERCIEAVMLFRPVVVGLAPLSAN